MNRNAETRYNSVFSSDVKRSKFDFSHDLKTTFNTGDIVPIQSIECLPGDVVDINLNSLIRLQTPNVPFMDNLFCDVFAFFTPYRLVWDNFREFMGEPKSEPWLPTVEHTIPQITAPAVKGFQDKTLMDYLGIPTFVPGIKVNALPIRSYYKIWNDWFRDSNLQYSVPIDTSDTDYTLDPTSLNPLLAGKLMKACKTHDFWTSMLPAPQRGDSVSIGVGGVAPVWTGEDHHSSMNSSEVLRWTCVNGFPNNLGGTPFVWSDSFAPSGTSPNGPTAYNSFSTNKSQSFSESKSIAPSNLWADLSSASSLSIASLRTASVLQQFYELLARSGNRYTDMCAAIFGTHNNDLSYRSEFCGSTRININVSQVVQGDNSASTPLGTTGAMSVTGGSNHICTYACKEHGTLTVLLVPRYEHLYQQGLERQWSRRTFEDMCIPMFSNIGEVPYFKREIFATGTSSDEDVFGYHENYLEFKTKNSYVTGEMRSNHPQSLDIWHFGDDYAEVPYLSSEWIAETPFNVDRCLTVSHEVVDQFFADFYFSEYITRALPMFSIPGIDKL